jgi:hypothetical protein
MDPSQSRPYPDSRFEELISHEEPNLQNLARVAYYDLDSVPSQPFPRRQPNPLDVIRIFELVRDFRTRA